MKVKEESEKFALKLNIQKTKIMASSPINSWQIDGETMKTVTDFIFLHSEITADGNCSHEIKQRLLLGRKAMSNLDSILKSRDITCSFHGVAKSQTQMSDWTELNWTGSAKVRFNYLKILTVLCIVQRNLRLKKKWDNVFHTK